LTINIRQFNVVLANIEMSQEIESACRYAIEQAKKKIASEVTPDDLLLGCFRTISQFGIAQIGPWRFDLEELGMDWLSLGEQKKHKVAYSQEVVQLLELAGQIARADSASADVRHLLAAYAGSEVGLIGRLKRENSITSADWRAAVADLALGSRASFTPFQSSLSMPSEIREYLTPEEASEILAIHVQTLRGHVRSGKLPALRLAGERAIRIRRTDLEKVFEPAVQTD
jgi:excisionase family DNA binding protein